MFSRAWGLTVLLSPCSIGDGEIPTRAARSVNSSRAAATMRQGDKAIVMQFSSPYIASTRRQRRQSVAQGMVLLPTLNLFGLRLSSYGKLGFYYLAIALVVAATLTLRAVALSDFGRYYAVARGVSMARQRLIVLVVSAIPTGIAGAFYAAYLRVASPLDSETQPLGSLEERGFRHEQELRVLHVSVHRPEYQ